MGNTTKFYEGRKVIVRSGYESVYFPQHPKARKDGTILVHVLIAEKIIGRHLRSGECVHHIDFNKTHNVESNLMVFKSNKDHANYHSALANNLDFELVRVDKVYTCKILYKKEETTCPICGKSMSRGAHTCRDCELKRTKKLNVSKEQLKELISTKSYEEIGRMYGVSGGAVSNVAKRQGVYVPAFPKCDDVNELCQNLSNKSLADVSRVYHVSVDTIRTWIKNYHIYYENNLYSVKCLETGIVFKSSSEAILKMFPQIPKENVNTVKYKLLGSIKNNSSFMGYTWSRVPNVAYIIDDLI